MMTQRLFGAVFAIFILTFSHCFADEENQGLNTSLLGPEWAVEETKFSEKRETVYSVRTGSPDMEFQEKHVEEPYEITQLELRKAVEGGMETVWTGESAFPKSCGPVFSGVTPHDGIVVWSVAESGGDMLVLCSVNTRLRVDVQRKDSEGRWQTVRTHPLGYIDSIHFEGKLIVGNDTIKVETTQWDEDNSMCGKGQTRRYAITQDGIREYSPDGLSTP